MMRMRGNVRSRARQARRRAQVLQPLTARPRGVRFSVWLA